MNWADLKTRLRRYLRDPDAAIFSDAFLLRAWNDVQRMFSEDMQIMEGVTALRVPALFDWCFSHEWEWANITPIGFTRQAFRAEASTETMYCFPWEAEIISGSTGTASISGNVNTQAWENAYGVGQDPMEHWFPADVYEPRSLSYDLEVMEPVRKDSLLLDDASWRSRTGEPDSFWRHDNTSMTFSMYPVPSTFVWSDTVLVGGTTGESGFVVYADDLTPDSEYGIGVFATGFSSLGANEGAIYEALDFADNICLIYRQAPGAIVNDSDEPDFPDWLLKYICYGVLERLYSANTDGQIISLRDYWGLRRSIAEKGLKTYKSRRITDRVYQLRSANVPASRSDRRPRLPDTYPPI